MIASPFVFPFGVRFAVHFYVPFVFYLSVPFADPFGAPFVVPFCMPFVFLFGVPHVVPFGMPFLFLVVCSLLFLSVWSFVGFLLRYLVFHLVCPFCPFWLTLWFGLPVMCVYTLLTIYFHKDDLSNALFLII